MSAKTRRKPPEHDPSNPSHSCYSRGCREEACLIEHRIYERNAKRRRSRPDGGRYVRELVDSREVREHLFFLALNGVRDREIARVAGVSVQWCAKVRGGRERVEASKARAVLGIGLHMVDRGTPIRPERIAAAAARKRRRRRKKARSKNP